MKILWVTAQLLPLVSHDLGYGKSSFGGWVMSMINQLKEVNDYKIGIAMCANISELSIKEVDGITCYVLPCKNKNKDVDDDLCRYIVDQFKPDLIHIEGTEFSIQNKFSKIENVNNIVSLQGILSGYEQYQYGGLSLIDMIFSKKISLIISAWTLFFRKYTLFIKRIYIEEDTIKNAQNLFGRTFWDRAHSYWINKEANYFRCNRILRDSFYNQVWSYNKCEKYSVFVGNGYSPLKGVHYVIKAIHLLKREYSNVKLYIAGNSPFDNKNGRIKSQIGYPLYLQWLINHLNLNENIVFTGVLSEEKIADRLSKSNVYVLPSLIENSPNTLGEAMIMGVPCVTAYIGGVSDMAKDEEEVLFYRANDPKLLAWQIKRVFDSIQLCECITKKAKEHANETHNPKKNLDDLLRAYNIIFKDAVKE